MNRTPTTHRPYDWQDRIVLRACWFTACAIVLILSFGV